ncbi:hypothetical protein LSAT2_017977 [Lamellibrachia satsuma]|nr:hypothetical protein LSAT2_017977 [Lamellibrachia satsuma]
MSRSGHTYDDDDMNPKECHGTMVNTKGSHDSMRVHFPADQIEQHDAHIIVQKMSETDIAVHLGFLQMNHHYEVKFSIKDELSEELITDPLQNIYAKVISVMPSEDGSLSCCQGLYPAVRVSILLSGSLSCCQGLYPAVRVSILLSGSPSCCQGLYPAVRVSILLSGSPSCCQGLYPAVRVSILLSGSPSCCSSSCWVSILLSGSPSCCQGLHPAVRVFILLSGSPSC